MNEKSLKRLYDIKLAIEEIESYFENQEKRFEDFRKNLQRKRATERNLEIIGEAMNQLLKAEPEIAITDARRIVGLRNQIIHGYDSVSDENIWAIMINHIPLLYKEVVEHINRTSALFSDQNSSI
jgi:uncharacterized protein with HEPN domain